MLTAVINYKKDRDVATIYTPEFFIQTKIDSKCGEGKITIKIKGVLLDMLVHMDPGKKRSCCDL